MAPEKPKSALLHSKEMTRDHKSLCQDSQEVAGRFNQFFTNIGLELAKNIPNTNHQFTDYFAASEAKFAFNPVDSADILPIVENIKVKKGHWPQQNFSTSNQG